MNVPIPQAEGTLLSPMDTGFCETTCPFVARWEGVAGGSWFEHEGGIVIL